MNQHHLPLLFALLLIALALVVNTTTDPGLPQLEPPSIVEERAARAVRLEMPPIADFAHYYGTPEDAWRNTNPFLPYRARRVERAAQDQVDRERRERERPVVVKRDDDDPPELPSVPENDPPPDPPQPPRVPQLGAETVRTPQVVGFIRGPAGRAIHVHFGDGEPQVMRRGETRHGWTLVRSGPGYAVFRDADGFEQRFPVGDPISGTTQLDGGHPGTGAAGGGGGGSTGMTTGDGGGGDAAAILRAIEADPRGKRLLQQNPMLREMLGSNPAAARKAAQRLGIDLSGIDDAADGP